MQSLAYIELNRRNRTSCAFAFVNHDEASSTSQAVTSLVSVSLLRFWVCIACVEYCLWIYSSLDHICLPLDHSNDRYDPRNKFICLWLIDPAAHTLIRSFECAHATHCLESRVISKVIRSFQGVFAQSKLDKTVSDIDSEDIALGEHKTGLGELHVNLNLVCADIFLTCFNLSKNSSKTHFCPKINEIQFCCDKPQSKLIFAQK